MVLKVEIKNRRIRERKNVQEKKKDYKMRHEIIEMKRGMEEQK